MKLLLTTADTIALTTAFFAAYGIRNIWPLRMLLDSTQPFSVYLTALPAAVILLLVVFRLRGLYHPRQRVTLPYELLRATQSVALWALLIMGGSYLVKYDYSRLIVLLFWLTATLFILIGRWIVGRIIGRLPSTSSRLTNVLIVGTGRPAKAIAQQLHQYRRHGYRVIGFVGNRINGEPVIGQMGSLTALLQQHRVKQVYFADPSLSYRDILAAINACPKPDVEFRVTSNVFPLINPGILINDLEAIPSLDLKKSQPSLIYRATKRTMDIVVGSIGFILTLPLWAGIVMAIRADSRGPTILKQRRVGKHGHQFTLYKFRTMQTDTAMYAPPPTSGDDRRVTRVGRILRRTSLDELPQLWNVISGDMSLVGPRPEMPFIVEQYDEWQKKRLCAKPGLTGLWQILGRKDLPLHDNLEYDFYYINNQSLLLDFVILLRTIPQILFGRGAY